MTRRESIVVAALEDAQECLLEYSRYGEAMRKIGRGFEPVATDGAGLTTVFARIRKALHEAEHGQPDATCQQVTRPDATCPDCGRSAYPLHDCLDPVQT